MATSKINENCHYVQNDPHKCKIKLKKFHFDILCRFGVIKESLPGEIGLREHHNSAYMPLFRISRSLENCEGLLLLFRR